MTKEIRLITPELAANWLRGSMQWNDRDSFRVNVDKYAQRILAGKWQPQLSHPAIKVERGTMIDGNHRMHAILRVGFPVLMVVDSDGTLDDPNAAINRTGRWRPYATDADPRQEHFWGNVRPQTAPGRWDPLHRG